MGLFSKLQNGDTVLKSLKFGNDRPGGGNSGQPYIQDPIPLINSPANTDFILRGGINAPLSAAQDVARLTKYMFNPKSPSGLLFTAKQNLLSRVAVPNEASQKWGVNGPGAGYAGGALKEGVYTPLSTLAQAGVGFLGGHLNKQGIDPTGLIPSLSIKKYEDVVIEKNKVEFNKLNIDVPIGAISLGNAIAANPLINGLPPFAQTANFASAGNVNEVANIATFSNRLLDIWYEKEFQSNIDNNILEYGGGPGSVLGIGKTRITFADQRTGINNSLFKSNKNYFLKGGKTTPSTYIVKDEVGNYKFTDTLNYNNLLGASVKEGLSVFETGINIDGNFNNEIWFNPTIKYSTLSKDSKGLSLSGSNGYQSDRIYAIYSHDLSPTYVSPINTILNSSGKGNTTNVSGSGRQLVTNLKYDQNIGTFVLQSNEGKNLGGYSSKNTLWNDNLNESYEVSPKNHDKGYLANLDKNAGYYIDKTEGYTFALAQYPRNIAPDFRKTKRKIRGFSDINTTYDSEDNLSGSYDMITTKGSDYISSDSKIIDKIYYSSGQHRTSNILGLDNDLIKFNITVINPTAPESSSSPLIFRAYIDNLSDQYSADWASQTYMGRGEKFHKYNSFSRDISLGFTVVADNSTNLGIMYDQLNTLVSSLAPTYTNSGYMAGNLHKITIGNYISNQYGIISGMSLDIMEESPWSVKFQDPGKELPMYIKVSGIKFTPIHDFRPEMKFNEPLHQFINQA